MNHAELNTSSHSNLSIAILTLMLLLGLTNQALAQSQWTSNGNNINNTNTGNVGIGTTTPVGTVTVNASNSDYTNTGGAGAHVLLTNPNASGQSVIASFINGTFQGKWRTDYAGNVSYVSGAGGHYFFTGGDWPTGPIRMMIANGGNVGIGTTTPASLLYLYSTANTAHDLSIDAGGTGVNQQAALNFLTLGDGTKGIGNAGTKGWHVSARGNAFTAAGEQNDLGFWYFDGSSFSSRLYLDSGGNLGIGTNTPSSRLSVSGGNIFHQYSTTPGQEYGFYTSINNNHVASNLFFDGQWKMLTAGKGATTVTGPFSNLAFAVYADNTDRAAGGLASLNQLFQVGMNGNVGVGTTAPGYRLDVQGGAVNASGGLCIAGDCKTAWSQVGGGTGGSQWTTSGSNIFYNTGNVGIGTATPTSAKLVISGTAGAEGLDLATTDQYANLRVIRNSNSSFDKDLYLQYQAGAGSKTHFYSNNSESMTLTNGNLGIGTTTPGAKLDVQGDINVAGNINAKYQDVAEWVPAAQALAAGTVVALNPTQPNQVIASTKSYDTRVAGVVSARPGLALGEAGQDKVLVATTGRVRVKVDASRAPIQVGDLLVTSDIEGVAMRSEPLDLGGTPIHRPGTLIGKALEPLDKGRGEILVLLSLQ